MLKSTTLQRGIEGVSIRVSIDTRLLLLILLYLAVLLCGQPDWEADLQPGILAALHGASPYTPARNFFTPPWAIPLLAPFAVLPHPLDNLALTAAAMLVYLRVLRRAGLLLFPPILLSLALGQLEWLAFAALLLPPWAGVTVALIKPQVGGGLALYWLLRGRWRAGVVFAVVFGLSVAVYGAWWASWGHLPSGLRLFPYTVPLGVGLMAGALSGKGKRWALASSPMFAPYLWHYHLAGLALLVPLPAHKSGMCRAAELTKWYHAQLPLSHHWRAMNNLRS